VKISNSFSISILSIAAVLLSGYLKLGVEAVIASVAATYVLGRSAQKYGISTALAKDPNSTVSDHVDRLRG
jgi:hypothetical protein